MRRLPFLSIIAGVFCTINIVQASEVIVPEAKPEVFIYGNEQNYFYSNPKLKMVEQYIDPNNEDLRSGSKYTYDIDGTLLRIVDFATDGEDISTTDYTYDTSGNLLKKVETSRFGDVSSVIYEYDDDGNITHVMGDLVQETFFMYENGLLSEADYYDWDGNLQMMVTIECDMLGNVTKAVSAGAGNSPSTTQEWKYNENGQVILEQQMSEYDGRITTFGYDYDDDGHMVYSDYNDSTSPDSSYYCEYQYDINGSLISKQYFSSDGQRQQWYEFDNDEAGNRIEKREYAYDGTLVTKWKYYY